MPENGDSRPPLLIALQHWGVRVAIVLSISLLFAITPVATSDQSLGPSREVKTRITSLFDQARRAEKEHDFTEALRLYNLILGLDPDLAEVWTNKGLVLHDLSRYREALAAFETSAKLKPGLLTPQLFSGIEYLKLGEPQNALKPLRIALTLEPHHPQATYELGNAYAQLEQFEAARMAYLDLTQYHPEMDQPWYGLGIAYLNWSKLTARKLIEAKPRSPYGTLLLAELQAVGGILVDAEANFRAAVEGLPNLVDSRLALARFYLDYSTDPGRLPAAREQLGTASSLASNDPRVLMAWARLELIQEKSPNALGLLQRVFEADPLFGQNQGSELLVGFSPEALRRLVSGLCKDGAASQNLARCVGQTPAVAALLYTAYDELGDAKSAEESRRAFAWLAKVNGARPVHSGLESYTQRAEELELAQHSRALSLQEKMDLGVRSFHLGKYDQALRALEQSDSERAIYWFSLTCRALAREAFLEAIKRSPDSCRSHLLLADLANDRHDAAQALAEYEKAAEIDAENPEIQLLFVQFLVSQQKNNEALARARAAVQRFPTHAGLNSEIGRLLLKAKKTQEAEPYLEQALAADPGLTIARAGLADVYAARGNLKLAIQEMKAALNGDPDGSYHYRLGRWLQKSGRLQEANEAFATSTRLKEEQRKRDIERFTSLRSPN